MVARRTCSAKREDGGACGATPLREEEFCLWHSPNHEEEVAEARVLGGKRRRRERIVQGVYDFEGLDTIPKVRRLVEVAVLDTLGLENSVNRSRTLAYLAQTAVKLIEAGELEERLAAIEEVMLTRKEKQGGKRR
jgi:hypothetical protein